MWKLWSSLSYMGVALAVVILDAIAEEIMYRGPYKPTWITRNFGGRYNW